MLKLNKCSRLVSLCVAVALLASTLMAFTGCETNHPKVTITISFLNEEYDIEYTLYRNMYPQTVRHFIELADMGYYDGLCVHDYSSAYLYTGGYNYDGEQSKTAGLVEKDYFAETKDKKLTQSVFALNDPDCIEGLGTLYGEFKANGYEVKNGQIGHDYGALVMYYTDKGSDTTMVNTKLSGSNGIAEKYYKYNSATSLFYIFTGETNAARNSTYCVFGKIVDTEALEELEDAIDDYIDSIQETDEDYSFTNEVTLTVDSSDPIDSIATGKFYATYNVPVEPIVIESVSVDRR